jgi:hypothetical protein
MAGLLSKHQTRQDLSAAFEQEGAKLNLRYEALINMPLMPMIEDGGICGLVDPLSAASYRLLRINAAKIVFRKFTPAIPFEVATLTPAYRPDTRVTKAFLKLLAIEMERFEKSLRDPKPVWSLG